MKSYKNRPLLTASIVLGIGLGGFFDGILFHQILQIHNMLSNIYFPNSVINLEINMFWDGLFHLFTLSMTLMGLFLLWKTIKNPTIPKSTCILYGGLLLGFGLFNFVEGITDHLILQIHHVIQRASHANQFYSDIVFILSGCILMYLGHRLIKRDNDPHLQS